MFSLYEGCKDDMIQRTTSLEQNLKGQVLEMSHTYLSLYLKLSWIISQRIGMNRIKKKEFF